MDYRPVENVRAGWTLAQASGTPKTVASAVRKPFGSHVLVTFADGTTDRLPVNTEVLSSRAEEQ